MAGNVAITDFVCPTEEARSNFDADFVVWMDTIEEGRFEDTNKVFVPPANYDLRITEWSDVNEETLANAIRGKLNELQVS